MKKLLVIDLPADESLIDEALLLEIGVFFEKYKKEFDIRRIEFGDGLNDLMRQSPFGIEMQKANQVFGKIGDIAVHER